MNWVYCAIFLSTFFASLSADAQDRWELKKEKDSIKVYRIYLSLNL
jgi:hypothetical protein